MGRTELASNCCAFVTASVTSRRRRAAVQLHVEAGVVLHHTKSDFVVLKETSYDVTMPHTTSHPLQTLGNSLRLESHNNDNAASGCSPARELVFLSWECRQSDVWPSCFADHAANPDEHHCGQQVPPFHAPAFHVMRVAFHSMIEQ